MKAIPGILLAGCLMALSLVQPVAGQGVVNETWFTVNMSGVNTSLLIIGMGGIEYSRQIINTEVTTAPEIPSVCYSLAPISLSASEAGPSSINVTWTKANSLCSNSTMVRGSQDGWPGSPGDGVSLYSGTDTSIVITGFAYDLTSLYIRAWAYNDNGYSADYISLRVGHPIGAPAVVFIIGILGLALWKKGWVRLLLALCLVIWGAFAIPYDVKIAAPLVAIGSLLLFIGILQLKEMGVEET